MTDPVSFLDGKVTLYAGDNREVLSGFADASIDSVVTDPPYGLGFMGKAWDAPDGASFAAEFWDKVLRVLKPGGHVVAFGGTRTYHRMACAIEDAGFEIRDSILDLVASDAAASAFLASLDEAQSAAFVRCIEDAGFGGLLAWVFGSGFPKSHDVAKAIDRHLGAEPRVVAEGAPVRRMIPGADQHRSGWEKTDDRVYVPVETEPATEAARDWQGWGTALKPAWEPIVLARKPLTGTVAATVLAHGTGALNVDGCRVVNGDLNPSIARRAGAVNHLSQRPASETEAEGRMASRQTPEAYRAPRAGEAIGRWPANVVHDGSAEVLAAFPNTPGQQRTVGPEHGAKPSVNVYGDYGPRETFPPRKDAGSAARFFYSSKAGTSDRLGSRHPTVKPLDLMRWLVRLVTPTGGRVLDPFAGTGTTGEAAVLEGMRAVLIERDEIYCSDIERRMGLVFASKKERRRAATAVKEKAQDIGPLFPNDGE